ncbi:MAG TPA: serpin family protein [Candidatus Eremiobacteraceae bacterium]|nr:serpin family protein [Candidatus Eremiobacteraceae bacterium]
MSMSGPMALAALLACLALVGGGTARGSQPPQPLDVGAAGNDFGFRLLNAVQEEHPRENVVLSPVSASLDLSMALNGASGETAQQMKALLAFDGSDLSAINSANAQLVQTLAAPVKDVTLSVADSLWADSRRMALRKAYVEQMQHFYGAEVADVDFGSDATPARINAWVQKKTQGKIPKIIDRINPADVALLLNALYFKGQWSTKFDATKTQPHDFTLADGSVKKVPLMDQSAKFDYFETKDMQAIRLPYGTGDLAMVVLLPAPTSNLAALEAELSPPNWKTWQGQFAERRGEIALPRFELKAQYVLNGPLQALGMKRAFEAGAAQFQELFEPAPGQSAGPNFFISSVLQATYLKVDEEGSEAAAVTSIGITMTAVRPEPPPFRMIVDRPFFCAIEDRRSHALLFVGAIYDPESSG